MRYLSGALLALALSWPSSTRAADTTGVAAPPESRPEPEITLGWDPAIRRGTLDNGLRYVIARRNVPPGRLEARLIVEGGSSLEADDERGLAHFCEHLAFEGTPRFPPGALRRHFESRGFPLGAHLNAFTSESSVSFKFAHPAATTTDIARALDVLADFAQGPLAANAQVEHERGVVLAEWRTHLGGAQSWDDAWRRAAHAGTRFEDRDPIGLPAVIETTPADEVRAFCGRMHRPDRMTAVLVGDFDPPTLEIELRQKLSGLTRPMDMAPPVVPVSPQADVRALAWTGADEASSRIVVALVGREDASTRDRLTTNDVKRDVAWDLLSSWVDGALAKLEARGPPVLGVMKSRQTLSNGLVSIMLGVVAASGREMEALDQLLRALPSAHGDGLSQADLDTLRRHAERGLARRAAGADALSSADVIDRILEAIAAGRPYPELGADLAMRRSALAALTLDDVKTEWTRRVATSRRVVLAACPAACVAEGDLRAAVDRWLASAPSTAPAETPSAQATNLLPQAPRAGTVKSLVTHERSGVRELALSNGLRVLLRREAGAPGRVLLGGVAAGGAWDLPPKDQAAAEMLGMVLALSGTSDHAAERIAHHAKARLTVTSFQRELSNSEGSSGLEDMMKAVHAVFARPAFRPDVLESVRELALRREQHVERDPGSLLERTSERLALADASRLPRPGAAEFTAVSLDDLRRLHARLLSDPAEWTLIFVGPMDLDEAVIASATWLGSIPRPDRQPSPPKTVDDASRRAGIALRATPLRQSVIAGPAGTTKTRITVGWRGSDPTSRWAANATAILLTFRLHERLRNRMGATYAVEAEPDWIADGAETAVLVVRFEAAPDRRGELALAAHEEIDRLLTQSPSEHEVRLLREGLTKYWQTAVTQDAFWMDMLTSAVRRGESPETAMGLPDRWAALTSASLHADIRTRLMPEARVEVWTESAPASRGP